MLDLSATLIAFMSFVAVILLVCGVLYLMGDRLEAKANTRFVGKRNRRHE